MNICDVFYAVFSSGEAVSEEAASSSPCRTQPIRCTNIRKVKHSSLFLTHSCPEISLTCVVWTFDTFQNNFEINLKYTTYLKESCETGSEVHIPFKYFLKIANVAERLL